MLLSLVKWAGFVPDSSYTHTTALHDKLINSNEINGKLQQYIILITAIYHFNNSNKYFFFLFFFAYDYMFSSKLQCVLICLLCWTNSNHWSQEHMTGDFSSVCGAGDVCIVCQLDKWTRHMLLVLNTITEYIMNSLCLLDIISKILLFLDTYF